MGVNKSTDRYLIVPEGSVMTAGFSAQLAKGQIGLFDVQAVGAKGATAVSSVAGADKNFSKFEVRLGVENKTARTLSNKPAKTLTFALSDITKAWVGRPHVTEQKFDEWYVGYNGFDTTKSFVFKPGETYELDLVVWGKPLGYLNQAKSDMHVAKYSFGIPQNTDACVEEDACEPVDCKEHTLNAVKYFNDYQLPTGDKLSKYFYISPVLTPAENPSLTEYTVYELTFCGSESDSAIGLVQAQYPNVEIVRDELSLALQMMIPSSEGEPDPFLITLPNLIPGCDGCPEGYEEIEGGYVYIVQFADEGEDASSDIEAAIPDVVSDSVVKQGQNFGVGYYMAVTERKLTKEELLDFASPSFSTAVSIVFAGEKDSMCSSTAEPVEIDWVEVATGNATVKTFEIVLQDDCNGSRLAELQAAYPELSIEVSGTPTPANCLRRYTTTVMTDVVFPVGCPNSTAIAEVYTAEAPAPFDVNSYWIEVSATSDSSYSCGIHIKAKPVIVNAVGECLIDELPFIATSMRVKPAGGYITNLYLNSPIVNNPFATLQVERAEDLDNLGGDMRSFERQGRFYFQNESYFGNVYARGILGLENQLEGLTQYTTYAFQVDRAKQAQGFGGYVNESIVYHMVVPAGKTEGVEALLNTLAAGAGVTVESL